MCKKFLWQSPTLRVVAAAHDGFFALESDTFLVRSSKVLLLKNEKSLIYNLQFQASIALNSVMYVWRIRRWIHEMLTPVSHTLEGSIVREANKMFF